MALGLPAVSSRAGVNTEIVRDGVDGFHWRTPAELVSRTRELIADPERLAAMSASAQERAQSYSSDAFTAGLHRAAAAALA